MFLLIQKTIIPKTLFIPAGEIGNFTLMIKVKIKEVGERMGINNAYQLEKITGFYPSKAAHLWKGEWVRADLDTLNTLCNLFNCTPNDILEFTPDESEE